MKKTFGTVMACALVCAVFAPAAFAQSAGRQGYDESQVLQAVDQAPPSSGPQVQDQSSGDAGAEPGSESLPFTGLDVSVLALMGLALVGTGVLVRRQARNPA